MVLRKYFLISMIILEGCCTIKQNIQNDTSETKIIVENIYSWINLMPGPSAPSLHVSAKVIVEGEEEPLLKMDQIEILQGTTRIIITDIQFETTDDYKERGEFIYTVNAKRSMKEVINTDKPFTMKFNFVPLAGAAARDKVHIIEMNDINIERVY